MFWLLILALATTFLEHKPVYKAPSTLSWLVDVPLVRLPRHFAYLALSSQSLMTTVLQTATLTMALLFFYAFYA